MKPHSPAASNPSEATEVCNQRSATGERIVTKESTNAVLERKHPLLGPRAVRLRALTVFLPPAFSPTMIASGSRTVVGYRDLLLTLTLVRLKVRYKQSI